MILLTTRLFSQHGFQQHHHLILLLFPETGKKKSIDLFSNRSGFLKCLFPFSSEKDKPPPPVTGAPLGVALLQTLQTIKEVETHLVMSKWAKTTIKLETQYSAREVAAMADVVHSPADQAASISSGSFRTDGMIIIPCSMKTLAGIIPPLLAK